MMDWKGLAAKAVDMAEQVAVEIVPGAGPAIEVAKKVVALGKEIKAHVPDGHDATTLEVTLAQLEKKVMDHADRTIASLGDGPT